MYKGTTMSSFLHDEASIAKDRNFANTGLFFKEIYSNIYIHVWSRHNE